MNAEKPKIILEFRGGILEGVYSNQKIEYAIVDWDLVDDPSDVNRSIRIKEADWVGEHPSGVYNEHMDDEKQVKEKLKTLGF